ncbi:MAG: hypothetical protein ACREU7_11850, partial [Burkholderiales bacterium]
MRLTALLGVATLLVIACASPKPKDGELPNPPQRMQQRGWSFLPPAEDRWFVVQKAADTVIIARIGRLDNDTHAIDASVIPLQAFASSLERHRFVKSLREQAVPAPRFRIKAHELFDQAVGPTNCAVSYLLAEDRQPDTGTSTVGSILVESMSLICPHPHNRSLGTMLTYTHRS